MQCLAAVVEVPVSGNQRQQPEEDADRQRDETDDDARLGETFTWLAGLLDLVEGNKTQDDSEDRTDPTAHTND